MQALHAPQDEDLELRFVWEALGARTQSAQSAATRQAAELTRALAAHAVVTERGAAVEEFEERLAALADSVWPNSGALQGYELHSSLGAFAIAKVAFDLVPAGRTGLRHEPLRREGVLAALAEHRVDETTAASVLGDWAGVQEGFRGTPDGLPPSQIAGLAERTLSRQERARALDQIAVSPRCLNRLASTLGLLAAARVLLPLIPPPALGRDALIGIVGLALGRPDRVVELFEGRAGTLRLTTLVELAGAQLSLQQGQPVTLQEDDLAGGLPPSDTGEDRHAAPRADTEVMQDAFDAGEEDDLQDDEDDVLEIVEEKPDPEVRLVPEAGADDAPRPPRWQAEPVEAADSEDLVRFRAELADERGVVARAGGLLGLSQAPLPVTVRPRPVPPDEGLLAALRQRETPGSSDEDMTERIAINPLLHGQGLEVEELPFDALLPPIRGALRAIARAAEGEAPSVSTVQSAGDLAWALARARALALVVQGDLAGAEAAVSGLPEAAAPEGRWARDRALRFAGRSAEPVDPRQARPVAAALIADLVQQLARTLAGTVPTHG